jgi:hypothetical protein
MLGYTFAVRQHRTLRRGPAPRRHPFTVTSVSYTVCTARRVRADQVHDVLVFTSAGPRHQACPSETISVPAPATPTAAETGRLVESLSSPVLDAGSISSSPYRHRSTGPHREFMISEAERNWWSRRRRSLAPHRTGTQALTIDAAGAPHSTRRHGVQQDLNPCTSEGLRPGH